MATDSIFYFSAAHACHQNKVGSFLLQTSPAQEDYDNLKADVTFLKDRCQEVLDWYGPDPGMDTLSPEQTRFCNEALAQTNTDLSDLAAFAVTKSLTP